MGRITSLFSRKVVGQIDPPIGAYDLLRVVGLDGEAEPDPSFMIRDDDYYRLFEEAEVRGSGAPKEVTWMLDYLFSTVLDGRNAQVVDGVERALGRPARGVDEWARAAAAAGAWRTAA